ncbi:MAG: CHAP domain-containing protein [Candidatus Dormibacteria bacterium]
MSQVRIKRVLRAAAQLGMFGIAAMAASLVTTGPASASYATEIQQLKAQQASLLQQLGSLQGAASTVGQEAAATQTQITAVQTQLTQDETELSQVTGELDQTKAQLVATRAQMAKDRSQLADLVTILYQRDGSDSMAAAIADSSSISKLVDDTVDLQTVRAQFDSLTQQLIADANALKKLQAQQQAQEQQVNTLVNTVQGQEDQLQTQESQLTTEQNSLTGQAATISAQVQQISAQIVVLEDDSAAGGSGSGSFGEIVNACNGCYSGPYLSPPQNDYTPVGQCTWFVATHAIIGWRANADDWIADDSEYPIGSTPQVGSIVVFIPGYNRFYSDLGHVAWVVAIGGGSSGTQFTVEEDNVESGGLEDMRIIPNTSGVMGFIYP